MIREGWPLLAVETEVNRDSKSTNERDLSLVGSFCLSWRCQYKRFLFSLRFAALVCPVQNIIFLTIHYFSFVPISQQAAGQAAALGRLSLSVCL